MLSLGLDRTPASDVIEVTLGTWHEAITTGRKWEQARDTSRIRAAFVSLAQTSDRWPQPKHFIDALPRMEDAPRIEKEFRPASPEVVARARAELDRFVTAPDPLPAEEAATEVKRLGDVEAELRQHYAGKVAACGPDA